MYTTAILPNRQQLDDLLLNLNAKNIIKGRQKEAEEKRLQKNNVSLQITSDPTYSQSTISRSKRHHSSCC